MFAMAQVVATYSWPCIFSGAYLRLAAQLHLLVQHVLAGDEQAGRAAARVVDAHARLGVHDPGHDPGDFRRREELAGGLAAALGELADEVLVAAADDVGLDVLEAQALLADPLDEVGEAVVVDVALAVGRGVEVHPVDDAFERGLALAMSCR